MGIQARSTSSRFPGKILEKIGFKTVLAHVVDQAQRSCQHVNKYNKLPIDAQVMVLAPVGDDEVFKAANCKILQGDEFDVLSRYVSAKNLSGADFVVRLTSDCPLIMDFMITKHINVAVNNGYDYVSNVEESCRTIADGFDCEVMSARCIDWLNANAVGDDREHVSTLLRKKRPAELSQGFIMTKLDTSHMKMSVDTPDDLEVIRVYYHNLERKRDEAFRLFKGNIYEL